MSQEVLDENRRILIVDDNLDIHADYERVLNDGHDDAALDAAEALLFGESPMAHQKQHFTLTHAHQGEEALERLRHDMENDRPFALAFVDMRMPPGWDGLETIRRLWQVDPRLQVVLCTAYSDYSWSEICDALSPGDRLLILKKPFDAIEVRQLAAALTVKWNLERKAERSQRDLEQQVVQRTRELQAAKEAADRASRSKSDFLANISHEVRTPLTAILGFTRLLMDEPCPDEAQECLQIIRASAEHQLTLINDLLDVAKIEAGEMRIHRVACSLPEIIDEVLQTLRFRAAEKGIELKSELAESLAAPVYSDPSRLRQLLINLVGNGIKFTASGSVRVRAASLHERGHRLVRIEVTDTGIGIAAEKQRVIFDPFVQADSSIAPRFGGTGLGLAISRSIADLLGGSLTLKSREGSGSTFTLMIDADSPEMAVVPSAPVSLGGTIPATGIGLAGKRILVAEDHPYNRKLIELALGRAGAKVATADDGKSAVDLALGADFDLVLMDMQMPIMDGFMATQRLRASGYRQPIIALTAHALPAERDRCLRAGCNAFVGKPIDLDHLKAVIRQLIGADAVPAAGALILSKESAGEEPSAEERALLDEFIESLSDTVADLRRQFACQAFDAMVATVHTLKGAGGTLGFPEVSGIATRMEVALGRADGSDLAYLLDQFAILVERLQREPARAGVPV